MEAVVLQSTVLAGVVAYIGPGPGLSMLTALLGLIGTVLVAILAIFSSPIRILIRKMRGGGDEDEADEAADAQAEDEEDTGEDEEDV